MNYPIDPLLNLARGKPIPKRVTDELVHDGYLTVTDGIYTITPQAIHLLNTRP